MGVGVLSARNQARSSNTSLRERKLPARIAVFRGFSCHMGVLPSVMPSECAFDLRALCAPARGYMAGQTRAKRYFGAFVGNAENHLFSGAKTTVFIGENRKKPECLVLDSNQEPSD